MYVFLSNCLLFYSFFQGDKIHVIVKNGILTFLDKYFKEDMVVLISNFNVVPNNTGYKYTKHPYRITFDGFETACQSTTFDSGFNKIGFEVTKFSDIISLNLDTELPVGMCFKIYKFI